MHRAMLIAATLAPALGAMADVEYTVTRLYPLPDAWSIVPLRLNNPGQVVGWSQGPGAITRAFVWSAQDGMTELPVPEGLVFNIARDINDDGIIVGHAKIDAGGNEHGWVYQNGQFTMLGGFAEPVQSEAWGINAQGWAAGHSADYEDAGYHQLFLWKPETGLIDIMPQYGGRATAVNDQGWVTGFYAIGINPLGAFRWRGPDLIDDLPQISLADDINNQGNIAGRGPGGGDPNHAEAFFYSDQTGPILIADIREDDFGEGINEDNVVVGTSVHPGTGWIWSLGGGLRELTDLIDPAENMVITAARDINEKGQIVGTGYELGSSVGVLLTPVGQGCPPDLDGNGTLDLFDFLAFVNLFNAGNPAADCDNSGSLDLFDFLCYTNLFNAGC